MHDHSLYRGRQHFCRYCLHSFIAEKYRSSTILKYHIKEYFKIDIKQVVKMSKKSKYVNFKSFQRKIKSPFMIYADFESILVPEDNGSEIQMSLTKTCSLQLWL